MSLKDRAAKINFDDLDDEAAQGAVSGDVVAQSNAVSPAAAPAPAPLETAAAATQLPSRPRTGVAALTERFTMQHRVDELQQRVAELESAHVVVMLDPKQVRQSKWKNRHELSFGTSEYQELKAEIEAAGGNVQPIKVRRAGRDGDGKEVFEVVYGRRRLRSCLELGLQVAAIVEDMDDVQLYKEMERENRNRADLSPWEQGVMYKDALDAKLFPSQRQMAATLNVSQTNLSMAIALASLPPEVIDAFPSPLDLQYRWAAPLTEALEKDTARVMTVAGEIAGTTPRPNSKEVFARLVTPEGGDASVTKEFRVADKQIGTWTRSRTGAISIKLKAGALNQSSERKLLEYVERLFS